MSRGTGLLWGSWWTNWPPKDTVKGDKYAMWKLSDLSAQSAVVLLFLFGKAYQEHWKMAQGSVVALLNPTIMPNREVGRTRTHTHTHTHTHTYSQVRWIPAPDS